MIINFLKGIAIGIANVIPGFSAATMALILGVYKDITKSISLLMSDFKNIKKYILFLFIIGIGGIIGIFLFSHFFSFLIDDYKIETTMFFSGIIFGSIPFLYKNNPDRKLSIGKLLFFLLGFLSVFSLYIYNGNSLSGTEINSLSIFYSIKLFFVGLIASVSMVIPGFSGSMMLVIFGEYENIMNFVKDLQFDKIFIIGTGAIIGIFLCARIIYSLLTSIFAGYFYYMIIGMVFASGVGIFPLGSAFSSYVEIGILFLVFIIGFSLSFLLGLYNN